MTTPDDFLPTLPVPALWINELAGTTDLEEKNLSLSYMPPFQASLAALGCTIAEIEADFALGYALKKMSPGDNIYYILRATTFKIWALPKIGRTTRNPLLAISKIERNYQVEHVDFAPLGGLKIYPIQQEVFGSADPLVARYEAYRRLTTSPPRSLQANNAQNELTKSLWRYEALGHLLDVLWRHSKHAPPMVARGNVLDTQDLPAIETRFPMGAHQRALRKFFHKEIAGSWENLWDLLAAPEMLDPASISTNADSKGYEDLTDEQRSAVEGAVSTPHAFFIQGPPGTGKTTVIAEIVQRLVARGERVLLVSSTHVAVDEALVRIAKKPGVFPLRIAWNADKVDASVPPVLVFETGRDALVKQLLTPRENEEAFWAKRKAEAGMNADRQQSLERMAERFRAAGRDPNAEEELKQEIGDALLAAANLICATTVGITSPKFPQLGHFDTLIVDEANSLTDAEFLICAVVAKRWILVGDEHQLPPAIEPELEILLLAMVACAMVDRHVEADLASASHRLAEQWKQDEDQRAFCVQAVLDVATPLFEGPDWAAHYRFPFEQALLLHERENEDDFLELLRTLRHVFMQSAFERAVRACPPALRKRLSEQRRMIEPITLFVRDSVYQGAYRSPNRKALVRLGVTPLLGDGFSTPVTFLNTELQGEAAAEQMVGAEFVNEAEARWIVEACESFENGRERHRLAHPISVSILCFYREQAKRIRGLLAKRDHGYQMLQFRVIDAVDRMQGQASDLVFISFCRSRGRAERVSETFGLWLRDIRRLNVAFTAARRALVLVGHRPTLEKLGAYEPFYSHLFDLFDGQEGAMRMVQQLGERRRRGAF